MTYPIQALILNKNEQQNLPRCRLNGCWADAIYVYDEVSRDNAVRIAEKLSIFLTETLVCGKPFLISNKVNCWHENENGIRFIDEDNVGDAVRNLNKWLSLDDDGYEYTSAKVSVYFSERFHIQKAAQRLLEIIQKEAK